MFDGRNVVDESTLVDALPMSELKIDGRIRTDNRFEDTINDLKGKDKVNMCEVLDRIEARGIEKGIEQGIKRGTLNTLISLVNDGILSIEEAATRVDMSVECFEKYMK